MPDREIEFNFRLPDGVDADQATLERIVRNACDLERKRWNILVARGQSKLSCGFTPEEVERRCEDALRQCGLPRSLRRLPPL